MMPDKNNPPADPEKPKASWVWCSTDESIAAEQVSMLAILETLVAVGMYWWLARHFEWPWMAFLSMIAAPLLLLRSEKSIAHGIQLLRTYWEAGEKEISRRDKIIISLITTLITGLLTYWLITYWLTGYIGWPLFWRATVLGSAAVISTVMVIYAVTVTLLALGNEGIKSIGTSTITCVALVSIVILAAIINIATDASIAFAGAIIGIGISVKMIANARFIENLQLLSYPSIAAGILVRGSIIRLYATLRHLIAGLAQLPRNWRETLLVIDCTHPPELLPQAGTIDPTLSVKEIWTDRHNTKGNQRLLLIIFLFILYFPALVYRWSLKASAWLWFPLALALKPPLHQKKAQDSRRLMASLHTWNWLYFGIATAVMLWLFSSSPLLVKLLPVFPPEYITIHNILATLLTPPVLGLFYIQILACFACLLAAVMIIRSTNLKASHGKLYDSPGELPKLTPTDKADFLRIAGSINKIRLLLIAVLIAWGEMMTLGFFHAHHPHTVEQFISPALLSYL